MKKVMGPSFAVAPLLVLGEKELKIEDIVKEPTDDETQDEEVLLK